MVERLAWPAVPSPFPTYRSIPPVLAAVLALLMLVAVVPADAQRTPGLDETRQRVQELTQGLSDAETELSEVERAIEAASVRVVALTGESSALTDVVVTSAIEEFIRADAGPGFLVSSDLNAARRAATLSDAAIGADAEAMERYVGLFEDLEIARVELEAKQSAAEEQLDALLALREELGVELARLEEIEKERLAEVERRRAAAQAAAERAAAAERTAAAERAAANNGATTSSDATPSNDGGTSSETTTSSGGGATSVAATGTGTLKACPVAGAHSFIDSWGYGRSGGRRHKGVDMMASTGTPIAAPVGGTVEHRSNRVGGRSFHLNGDDGNYYYGTHLSGYEKSGQVNAGDIIGYVGDDGNARGIPHLHFEVHPGGGGAVNPFPYVSAVC